jgi:hypothetical protein
MQKYFETKSRNLQLNRGAVDKGFRVDAVVFGGYNRLTQRLTTPDYREKGAPKWCGLARLDAGPRGGAKIKTASASSL